MSPWRSDRLLSIVQSTVLAALTLLLVFKAAGSTRWRMEHDTPLLHYCAFLINEHDLAPYRDIFETSMPGTLLFHTAIGSLFGYGDIAFRWVDLVLLTGLSLASFAFMRRFGFHAGWAAAIFFPLIYLGKGNAMSLQRDYLGILPIALAFSCIPRSARSVGRRRFVAIGALFGVSALIKPHLALGLPIFLGALLAMRWQSESPDRRDLFRCFGAAALGALVPIALALAWLATKSSLGAFFDLVVHYLPLHNAITGSRELLEGSARRSYLFHQTLRLGGYGTLALATGFAAYHALTVRRRPISAALVLLCAVAYLFYPSLAGKFWSYHFMPTVYFLTLACALLLTPFGEARRGSETALRLRAWVATLTLIMVVQLQLNLPRYLRATRAAASAGYHPPPPKQGRVDEIAKWLRNRMRPGDTVQPLDWAAGGAVHAMLLARAELATRYLYDYHFYHHVSRPYIQDLRRSLLADLKTSRPRFVIESRVAVPRVSGHDTGGFFEIEALLLDHYQQVRRGDGYSIYERKGTFALTSSP